MDPQKSEDVDVIDESSETESEDEEREDCETETESEDENVATTVNFKKIPESVLVDKIRAENALLRKQIESIERQTRKEMEEKFHKILEKQDLEFNELERKKQAANQNLSRRRISMVVKCFTQNPPHNSPDNKGSELQSLKLRNMELEDTIRELEENVDEKAYLVKKYQMKMKMIENAVENSESVEELQTALKVLYLKIGLIDTETKLEHLTLKLEEYQKEEQELKNEVEDGYIMCLKYRERVEIANKVIRQLTAEVKRISHEKDGLELEQEMMHSTINDLQGEAAELRAKYTAAEDKISKLKNAIENAPQRQHLEVDGA